jgi:hypothetical protein
MKKTIRYLVMAVAIFLGFNLEVLAQPWTYDFGTATGTHPTNSIDTAFFSNKPINGGTYRVRTGGSGGTIELANPGTSLGTGSELQINAATNNATNKFTVYNWSNPSSKAHVKFKIRTTSSANGILAFHLGTGTTALFNGNTAYADYNNSISTFWIVYNAGEISVVNRRGSGSTTAITSHGFAKDSDQIVEVFANNGASSTTYYKNATTYTLDAQTWDLWVDGTKISPANGWAKPGTLAADNTIGGLGFFAETSSGNVAWMYLDDLEYSNALPAAPAANFDLTFGVVGANGNLTATVDAVAITSPASVQQGKNVVFTAAPAIGFKVKEWKLNNVAIASNTTNNYTLSNVQANANVTVEFEAIPTTTYAVTFGVVNGNGDLSATVDGGAITSPANVLEGKDVVFTAAPAIGFQVKEWKLNNVIVAGNTTNNYTLLDVVAISNVTVEFEAIPTYTLTFTVKNIADDDITNATITLNGVANAAGDYVFTNIPAGACNFSVSAPTYQTISVTGLVVTESTTINIVMQTQPVATLPINYSGPWSSGLPAGWSQTGLGGDYAGVAARLDDTGDMMKVHFNGTPNTLSYTIKANVSGTWSGEFNVQESVDGTTWTNVKKYETAGELTGTVIPETFTLLSTTRVVRWIYTNKINGNIAVDDVVITQPAANFDVTFGVVGANGNLTATVDAGAITSPASVQQGKNVVFTAAPATDFQVKEWKLNNVAIAGNTTNNYTLSNVQANANVTVEFEAIPTTTYAVTFSVVNGNGDLSATVDGGAITSPANVLEGKDVVFTAAPAIGFQVKEWKLNNVIVTGNTTNNYTLLDVEGISNVTVEFEAIPTYTLTFTVKNATNVDITNAIITFNGVANAAGDYVFNNIVAGTYNYSVSAPSYQTASVTGLVVTETTTIPVVLQSQPIATLPINYSGPWQNGLPAGWSQTGLGTDYANAAAKFDTQDDQMMVQFGEEPGMLSYKIKGNTSSGPWSGIFDVLESADGVNWTTIVTYSGSGALNTTNYQDANHSLLSTTRFVKWFFTEKVSGSNVGIDDVIITLPLQNFDLTFSVVGANGNLIATVDAGAITSPASVQQGKNVVFTATPDALYQVKEWKLNDVVVAGNTSNSYTLSNIQANANVTVEFEEIPTTTFEVTFSVVNGNGDLSATVDGGAITSPANVLIGKNIIFAANPLTNFQVKEWKVNNVIVDNNTTLAYTLMNLQADANVTVEFEAVPTYTVTFVVKNASQAAITNAIITFNGVQNNAGEYVFTGIYPGTYSYSIESSGYQAINLTTVGILGDSTITVTMQEELVANLPIDYSGPWQNNLPAGWSQNGLGADYANAAARFDGANDYLKVRFNEEPGFLKFNIRAFTSGTSFPWNGTFEVLESADGIIWTEIVTYSGSGAISNSAYATETFDLLSTTRYVKWFYDEKVSGNVAIDNVIISLPLQNFDVTFDVVGANGNLTATVDAVAITSPASVQEGKDVVFTAAPATDYQVKEWKFNNVVVAGNTSNTYTVSSIDADADVTVEFEEIPPVPTHVVNFSVVGANGTLTAKVDNVAINSGDEVEQGKDVDFTAAPANGYRVKQWTVNSTIVPGITANEYTVANIVAETNVNVEFELDDTRISDNNNIHLNIYPNPSNGLFTIVSDGLYTMEVLDIQGRVMVRSQLQNGLNVLDMTVFADGIYVVRVNNAKQVFTTRISKSE